MGVGSTALLVAVMATAAGDLEDAITLYQNKDYRGALAAFGRAGAQPQSPRRRALIHAYIGILQFRFGLEDDAKNSFEESLSHHDSIAFPDPSQAGAQRLYESLKPAPPEEKEKEPKKRKKRKKRRRRRRTASDPPGEGPFPDEIEEDDPDDPEAIAVAPPPPVPTFTPPPPPPPITATTTPSDDGTIVPWVLAGSAVAAAIAGTVLIVVGRANGNAAQDPMTSATEAQDLYSTHRVQVGIGIGALVAAGVAGGVAGVLFATE